MATSECDFEPTWAHRPLLVGSPGRVGDGALLAGRYRLGGEIARGGMGVVFRAEDERFGRDVAVKVLLEGSEARPDLAERFAYEAEVTARLQHPGVPPVHDLGVTFDGRPFLVMKLIHGRTLESHLAGRASPAAGLAGWVGVFGQVTQAVAHAHSRGVVHRDLKPGNVMVGQFGEVQVMDWGIAKEPERGPDLPAKATGDVAAGRTLAGSILGTPAYMAPEQARGEVCALTARADVFALGAILCEVLTGRPPINARTGEEAVRRCAAGDFTDAHAELAVCGADPALVNLATRCLAFDPAGRPADAAEVARTVADYQAGVEARLRRAEVEEARAAERRLRRRGLTAAAVLVAGVVAVAAWREREADLRAAAHAARERDDLAGLLDRAENALRDADEIRAESLLGGAARPDSAPDLLRRCEAYRSALAVLRRLNRIDEMRWAFEGGERVDVTVACREWSGAFADYGIVPGVTPPAGAAEKINASPVRGRLLAALEAWFDSSRQVSGRSWFGLPGREHVLFRVLKAADPDPFRVEARRAGFVAARAAWGEGGRAVPVQPGWFVAAHAAGDADLLTAAHRRHPDDVAVLMALSRLGDESDPSALARRAGWCRAILAAAPKNAAAWNNLGVCLAKAGDPEEALTAFRRAVELAPDYPAFHVNLGVCLSEVGDHVAAQGAYQQASRLRPGLARHHRLMAAECLAMKDLDGALRAAKEAARLNPRRADCLTELANVHRLRGDRQAALRVARRAVEVAPRNAKAHLVLSQYLLASKRWRQAAAVSRKAARLDPDLARSYQILGYALKQDGDLAGAEAALREAACLEPVVANYHPLAQVLSKRGKAREALEVVRIAVEINPRSVNSRLLLSIFTAQAGLYDESAAACRAVIRHQKWNARAHAMLSYVLKQQGDITGAREAAEKAAALNRKKFGHLVKGQRPGA